MKEVIIYTDGACEGNPGPGGWGYTVVEGDKEIAFAHGGETDSTNNRMELQGVIEALAAQPDGTAVTVYSDSKYVVNGSMQWLRNWKRRDWRTKDGSAVKNKEHWEQIDRHMARLTVRLFWVKGHVGNKWNERADELSLMGLAQTKGVPFVPREAFERINGLSASIDKVQELADGIDEEGLDRDGLHIHLNAVVRAAKRELARQEGRRHEAA